MKNHLDIPHEVIVRFHNTRAEDYVVARILDSEDTAPFVEAIVRLDDPGYPIIGKHFKTVVAAQKFFAKRIHGLVPFTA